MSKLPYQPKSHYFVDHATISNLASNNLVTDAFGPVKHSETTKYRTTSIIRSAVVSKVFAICKGALFIQPQTGDATKVNFILKPWTNANYSPFKIKYFIYRGVNKSDLIVGNNLKVVDPVTSPTFLQKIWTSHINRITSDGSPAPTTFPANLIGYDPSNQLNSILISSFFFNSSNDDNSSYEIQICEMGEHIGNFTGEIGLDVVLDYGDYELDYEEELFKLDLEFARKKENVFDLTTIAGAIKQKRYKEYIHQFIDAAAFWGSHIDVGEILLKDTITPSISTIKDVYEKIVNRYQTRNKLYLYVQSERGRSYNYYGDYPTGKLSFGLENFSGTGVVLRDYHEHNWPIVIKEYRQPPGTPKDALEFSLEFEIDATRIYNMSAYLSPTTAIVGYDFYNIHLTDRTISQYVREPKYVSDSFTPDSYMRTIRDAPRTDVRFTEKFNGQTTPNRYIALNNYQPVTPANSDFVSVSNFLLVKTRGIQKTTTSKYFDDLWYCTTKNTFNLSTVGAGNVCNWLSYNRIILKNLKPIIGVSDVSLTGKVFFDTGKNSSGISKARRLYMSMAYDLNSKNKNKHKDFIEFKKNSISNSGYESNLSINNYSKTLYNDNAFEIFKGNIDDSGTIIPTLTLVNSKNHILKQFYFQLGLLEEEYNKILYDNVVIPSPLPSVLHIPIDAANIRFHLEEITSTYLTNKDFRKFRLGVRYEDSSGTLVTKLPSSINEVIIYTIDGFYFFTKQFAEYQEFYNSFSGNSSVHFRPKKIATTINVTSSTGVTSPQPRNSWEGNFGFDWIRINDTSMSNDTTSSIYKEVIGHYYDSTSAVTKVGPNDPPTLPHSGPGLPSHTPVTPVFIKEKQEWHSLKKTYKGYPIIDSDYSEYSIPWLSLYPSFNNLGATTVFPKMTTDGTLKCLVEAQIELKISIKTSPTSLKIKFEKDHFSITPVNSSDVTVLSDVVESGINFGLLEINNKTVTGATFRTLGMTIRAQKEFSQVKKIQIISTSGGLDRIAGELSILPNDKNARKETKLLLVNVKSNVPSRPYDTGIIKEGMDFTTNHDDQVENKITAFFNQALIDIISLDKITLDVTPGAISPHNPSYNPTFNTRFVYPIDEKKAKKGIIDLYSDLINFNPANSSLYANHFIIFFLDEGETSSYYGLSEFIGIRSKATRVIVFHKGLNDGTPAHELLHVAGLHHTFSNLNELTIEENLTDNIMDYSDVQTLPNPLPVVSLWKRQWDIIRNNQLVVKEP